MLTFDLMGKV